MPRPECPKDRSYTVYDTNPFTKQGRAYREWLEERDEKANAKLEDEEEVDQGHGSDLEGSVWKDPWHDKRDEGGGDGDGGAGISSNF